MKTSRFTQAQLEQPQADGHGPAVLEEPTEPPFLDLSLNEVILFAAVGSAVVIASAMGWF